MKNKSAKKGGFIRLVCFVICGAVLGINLYLFNANRLLGNQLPMPFGYGAAVVLSGSMEPRLSVGDLIIVQETSEINENDIVVFQEHSSLVVHRVIAIDGTAVTTQGDANNVADSPVDVSVIKGKVILSVPFVGTVVNFLKTPAGIIGVIALAIFSTESSFRKEKEADSEELEKIKEEIRRLKDGE